MSLFIYLEREGMQWSGARFGEYQGHCEVLSRRVTEQGLILERYFWWKCLGEIE